MQTERWGVCRFHPEFGRLSRLQTQRWGVGRFQQKPGKLGRLHTELWGVGCLQTEFGRLSRLQTELRSVGRSKQNSGGWAVSTRSGRGRSVSRGGPGQNPTSRLLFSDSARPSRPKPQTTNPNATRKLEDSPGPRHAFLQFPCGQNIQSTYNQHAVYRQSTYNQNAVYIKSTYSQHTVNTIHAHCFFHEIWIFPRLGVW